ncbi:MAG: hypothetical protein WCO52_04710 [bacterium]
MATTVTINVYSNKRLMQEHDQHLNLIEKIKGQVSTENDNLSNPVPLFEQLESPAS